MMGTPSLQHQFNGHHPMKQRKRSRKHRHRHRSRSFIYQNSIGENSLMGAHAQYFKPAQWERILKKAAAGDSTDDGRHIDIIDQA